MRLEFCIPKTMHKLTKSVKIELYKDNVIKITNYLSL